MTVCLKVVQKTLTTRDTDTPNYRQQAVEVDGSASSFPTISFVSFLSSTNHVSLLWERPDVSEITGQGMAQRILAGKHSFPAAVWVPGECLV